MNKNSRILVAGDKDIVTRALANFFEARGFKNIFSGFNLRMNLISQGYVSAFFKKIQPEYVFLTSVKSGGIAINAKYPAEFIYDNIQAEANIIHQAHKSGVKKLIFFGSSCIYPRQSKQPIKEEFLLAGKLEETSESYAIAKIAGIKMAEAYRRQYGAGFISLIPATIYGPGDDFDLNSGHVIPALIRKFHDALVRNKSKVVIWGSGRPQREFIYIDDLVHASIFLMNENNSYKMINCGCGKDISIRALALLIKDLVGFRGDIVFDATKPDGVAKKLLDNSRMKKLGWEAKVSLEEGVKKTYGWYKENIMKMNAGRLK